MSKELLMVGIGMAGMPLLGSAKRLGYALPIGSFLLRGRAVQWREDADWRELIPLD